MALLGQQWIDEIEISERPAEWVYYISEIAAGSKQKYTLCKRTGRLRLKRALPDGLEYPTNYGFIPHTRSEADGEEIDLLAITTEPLLPLTICHVRVIGGFTIHSTDKDPEDKLVGVAVHDPRVEKLHELADLDDKRRAGIEAFFSTYKRDRGIIVNFQRWFDRLEAIAKLEDGIRAARRKQAA